MQHRHPFRSPQNAQTQAQSSTKRPHGGHVAHPRYPYIAWRTRSLVLRAVTSSPDRGNKSVGGY